MMPTKTLAGDLAEINRTLDRRLSRLKFAKPVTHVYRPCSYAREPHEAYLALANNNPEALFLGMNPGPWGMAQTGVPFGEVDLVNNWLGITGKVGQPKAVHPKRPVDGLDCARSEVSGRRLWGWAQERFVTPEAFFARFFVYNYCPLAFMEESGRNRTPDKLPVEERRSIEQPCDEALRQIVELLQPDMVIGVGKFAQQQAKRALGETPIPIETVLHPSPASPIANRGWAPQAEKQLLALGIQLP